MIKIIQPHGFPSSSPFLPVTLLNHLGIVKPKIEVPELSLSVFPLAFWPRRGAFLPGPDPLDWKMGRKDFSALPSQMFRLEADPFFIP
jgi:hypothetical protein